MWLIKQTNEVDNAILLVQQNLNNIANRLKETDQLDNAIDIAVRVRTVKKILFPDDIQKSANERHLTLKSSFAERQVPPPLSPPLLLLIN